MTNTNEQDEIQELVEQRIKAMALALLKAMHATTPEGWNTAMREADQYRPALTIPEQNRATQMARDMSTR